MQTNGKVFNGVKVFSATMVAERQQLGETVTEWIRKNPHLEILDKQITQSSDERFHCLAITLFYYEDLSKKKEEGTSNANGGGRTRGTPETSKGAHSRA